MASGDHAHTAVHVAQACGILDADRPVAVLSAPQPVQSAADKQGAGPRGGGGGGGGGGGALEVVVVDAVGRCVSASPGCGGAGAVAARPRPGAVADAVRDVAEGALQCAVTGPALRALRDAAAAARRGGAAEGGAAAEAGMEMGPPGAVPGGWLEVVLTQ
jgi:magnesium-transporting ATPase (P-type)